MEISAPFPLPVPEGGLQQGITRTDESKLLKVEATVPEIGMEGLARVLDVVQKRLAKEGCIQIEGPQPKTMLGKGCSAGGGKPKRPVRALGGDSMLRGS